MCGIMSCSLSFYASGPTCMYVVNILVFVSTQVHVSLCVFEVWGRAVEQGLRSHSAKEKSGGHFKNTHTTK